MNNKYLFILFFSLLLCLNAFSQEIITITTYYPSPVGVYQELRANRTAIGDNYSQNTYCWPPDACIHQIDANADLVVEGNLGVGTINPTSKLHVLSNGTNGLTVERDGEVSINVRGYGGVSYPIFGSTRGRGTIAAPSSVLSGDELMVLNANGQFQSNGSATGGQIIFAANQNWSSAARGTRMVLSGVNDNAGNMSEWMRLANGNVGIGTNNPQARLDVQGGNLRIGAYTLPNTDGTSGQVLQTNGSGAVAWGNGGSTTVVAGHIRVTDLSNCSNCSKTITVNTRTWSGVTLDYRGAAPQINNLSTVHVALASNTDPGGDDACGLDAYVQNMTANSFQIYLYRCDHQHHQPFTVSFIAAGS